MPNVGHASSYVENSENNIRILNLSSIKWEICLKYMANDLILYLFFDLESFQSIQIAPTNSQKT